MAIAQMCCSALAQAQTPNMTGKWNVEITFANAEHRTIRFNAQADGKGTLMAADPNLKFGGPRNLRRAHGPGAKEIR